LSKELAPFNILVNVVAVGKIKSMQQERSAEARRRASKSITPKPAKTVPARPHG
jgi:NAD(P)-dependent dehydrogenase (short-subunit alcohol dehydrogenase family)